MSFIPFDIEALAFCDNRFLSRIIDDQPLPLLHSDDMLKIMAVKGSVPLRKDFEIAHDDISRAILRADKDSLHDVFDAFLFEVLLPDIPISFDDQLSLPIFCQVRREPCLATCPYACRAQL